MLSGFLTKPIQSIHSRQAGKHICNVVENMSGSIPANKECIVDHKFIITLLDLYAHIQRVGETSHKSGTGYGIVRLQIRMYIMK